MVLPMLFWLMNSVCPPLYFNLDFKATIEKHHHISKTNLHYKSSSDSAKMAVYLSSSWESHFGSFPKHELCM